MKSLQLDLSNLVTAIVLIAVFAMAVRVPISPDMWWHLRCGQVQWQTKSVIQSDLFSHTAHGTPWVNQSWLPQLMMYGLYALGGLPALALSVAALVAATFGFVLATAQSKGRYDTFWRAFVVLWAAISTGRVWAARPHLTTFLLTAVWTCLLDRQRRKGDGVGVLAWLPPLMAVWANCHGGYVVGFLLLGAEIGGRILDALWQRQIEGLWTRLRPLLLVTVLVALAALLNPQGLRLLLFPFQTLGSYAQQQYVAEWASPDFHAVDLLPFLALLLATWSAAALGERRIAGGELLRLLGFTAMSLRSGRYLGLCAVVIAPILISRGALAMTQLGKHWGRPHIASSPARGSPVLNWALLILILIAAGIKVAMPLSAQTIDLAQQRCLGFGLLLRLLVQPHILDGDGHLGGKQAQQFGIGLGKGVWGNR